MSDNKLKPNETLSAKFAKPKRLSTVSVASSSRASRLQMPATAIKPKNVGARPKVNQNSTIIGEADLTIIRQEGCMPDFDEEHRQIAYGDFLRAMLEECLVDEKIEREETEMDIQMTYLAQRFKKTMDMLDKTNRRLKDVSFVVEQKRLQDLKENDCSKFYEMTDKSNAKDLLDSLKVKEQECLDKLDTKNIDFGYDKTSGHRQLLDAVNEAITGLEVIKKQSKLNIDKFKEYERSQTSLESLEKDRLDFESLKADFEAKFPQFSEKLMMEASEQIAKVFNDDD